MILTSSGSLSTITPYLTKKPASTTKITSSPSSQGIILKNYRKPSSCYNLTFFSLTKAKQFFNKNNTSLKPSFKSPTSQKRKFYFNNKSPSQLSTKTPPTPKREQNNTDNKGKQYIKKDYNSTKNIFRKKISKCITTTKGTQSHKNLLLTNNTQNKLKENGSEYLSKRKGTSCNNNVNSNNNSVIKHCKRVNYKSAKLSSKTKGLFCTVKSRMNKQITFNNNNIDDIISGDYLSEEIRKKMLVDYDRCLINDDDSTKPITNFINNNASCSNNNNLSSVSNNFKNTIYSIVQIDSNKSMKKEYIPNSSFKVYNMLNKTILNNSSSNNNINIDTAPKIQFKNKYKNLINTFRK